MLALVLSAGTIYYGSWPGAILPGLMAAGLLAAALSSGISRPGSSPIDLARKAVRLRSLSRALLGMGLLMGVTLGIAKRALHLPNRFFQTPFNRFALFFFVTLYLGGLLALGLYSYRIEQYKRLKHHAARD